MKTKKPKPYRIITYYGCGYSGLRKKLNDLGVEWIEQNVFADFYGIQFNIMKPTGKGAKTKMKVIDCL